MRVEQLVGHLIGVIERISVMAKGGSVDDVPFILELDPTEWNTAYQQRAVDARASWADVALLTTPINLPWAVLPGFAAVSMYVNEVTVHSWDLAVATGQRPTWDESVADLAYQFMQQGLPAEERHDAPFDDAVDVPASASSIDRLVAWNGRQPGWKA